MESKTQTKPFKILLAIRSLDFGGAERQWVLLAKELAKDKSIDLHLCTIYGGGKLELEIQDIPHTCLNKKGRGDFGFLSRYYKLIKAFNPNCIYAFMPEMNLFSLICGKLYKKECKIVFGFRSSAINVSKLPFVSKLYFYAQKFLSSYANAIICNSQDAISFYKDKGYSMDRSFVVHNGIDTERFCPSDSSTLKQELGIARDCFVFGISARMNAVKDYPLFASVAKEFLENLKDKNKVAFISLGKTNPEIMEHCKAILAPYAMEFLGAKNSIERYYPLFDCIVSASYTESFSNSIAEGMACGCVPIVSDVGESKIIANFKQDSYQFCFNPKDVKGALECFQSLYALKNSSQLLMLKKQAREHIINAFSPKQMLAKTLEVLKGL